MPRARPRYKRRIGFTLGEPERIPVRFGPEVPGHYEEFTDDVAKYEEERKHYVERSKQPKLQQRHPGRAVGFRVRAGR